MTAAQKKHTYLEMIQVALLTLNETGGSSRQELWKCVGSKFPEADYKQFLVRLKKLSADSKSFIVHGKNVQRFALDKKYKDKLKRRLEKGLPIIKAIASASMTDSVKKAMKKPKKKIVKKPKKSNKKKMAKDGKQKMKGAKSDKSSGTKAKGKQMKQDKKKTSESKETKSKL